VQKISESVVNHKVEKEINQDGKVLIAMVTDSQDAEPIEANLAISYSSVFSILYYMYIHIITESR
jgi:uncharacterized protein with PIN domain